MKTMADYKWRVRELARVLVEEQQMQDVDQVQIRLFMERIDADPDPVSLREALIVYGAAEILGVERDLDRARKAKGGEMKA